MHRITLSREVQAWVTPSEVRIDNEDEGSSITLTHEQLRVLVRFMREDGVRFGCDRPKPRQRLYAHGLNIKHE